MHVEPLRWPADSRAQEEQLPDIPAVVIDANLFVDAGFNPRSDAASVSVAVRAGTRRLVWDEATRLETEFIIGKIPLLRRTDLAVFFGPDGRC